MESKITYNGKEYDSINDLPPEARKTYENKDKNISLNNSGGELPSNFKFKLIMLIIFFVFMIYFIYSLIRILSR